MGSGLLIDDRTGSKELAKYFQAYGIQPIVRRLTFGDFAWYGEGPDDCKVNVTVERKTVDDLLQSVQSKRLAGHQLPGMADTYDFGYLIVEGPWRTSANGMVEVPYGNGWTERGFSAHALLAHLMGLTLRAGLIVWPTGNRAETVSFLVSQYKMWTTKSWDEHRSHDAMYNPSAAGVGGRRFTLRPRTVTQAERHAALLPGIDAVAQDVARAFPTVKQMVGATKEDWTGLLVKVRDKKNKTWKKRKLGAHGLKAWEALRT